MTHAYRTVRSGLLDIRTTTNSHSTRITIAGQADISTRDQLRTALAAADTRGRHVELQLSQLYFCDVTAACEILEIASQVRRNGGDVRVVDRPYVWVAMMLRVLDAANDLPLPDSPMDGWHRLGLDNGINGT